jgi:hypothetical protein
MFSVGDYILLNDLTRERTLEVEVLNVEGKSIFRILNLETQVVDFLNLNSYPYKFRKANLIWRNFRLTEDPWEFENDMEKYTRNGEGDPNFLDEILFKKKKAVLNWYLYNRIPITKEQVDNQVYSLNKDNLIILESYRLYPSNDTLDWAIDNRYMNMVEYLIIQCALIPSTKSINNLCRDGTADQVQKLITLGYVPDRDGVDELLKSDSIAKNNLVGIYSLQGKEEIF